MMAQLSERGQVVIPKKIRDAVHVGKGDQFEVETDGKVIFLKPVRRFKATKWQDYAGIAEGIAEKYLKDKAKEKEDERVYP
jgi:AbrB family looped-hinge helix DNA binding protein